MLFTFAARIWLMEENIKKDKSDWFKSWFNSPYYHILYRDRDNIEAENFISLLFRYLNPSMDVKILDVACGQGRHAIHMNKLGYNVDAFDLSENSIMNARLHENEKLHFFINDIRSPLKLGHYNLAFNLFTSFGYFSEEDDNYQSIEAIANSLTKKGLFIMDFMNVDKVINDLVSSEIKTINGISFIINREVIDGFIIKNIAFIDKGRKFSYQERVKAITLSDFERYFKAAGLKLTTTFGDYKLSAFDNTTSDRLIMIVSK